MESPETDPHQYSKLASDKGAGAIQRKNNLSNNWTSTQEKYPDAGQDWGQEKKGMTEDEMHGRHHRLDELVFELTPGVGDRQGGLACCNSWGRKESDTTELLN